MFNFLLGVVAMLSLALLIKYVGDNKLEIHWWQWLLTGLGVLMAVITLSSIFTLIAENEAGAAQVVGVILGVITITWGVLLSRFVFSKA